MFLIGDVVVAKKGSKEIEITGLPEHDWDSRYKGRYMHNRATCYISKCKESDYTLASDKDMSSSQNLYTYLEDGVQYYGIHVGTNTQGHYILELKGKGDYIVKKPSEVEEVVPYTFSLEVSGKEIHYKGELGKVNVGDLLVVKDGKNLSIVAVKAVDTKCKTARSKFKGYRLLTEEV